MVPQGELLCTPTRTHPLLTAKGAAGRTMQRPDNLHDFPFSEYLHTRPIRPRTETHLPIQIHLMNHHFTLLFIIISLIALSVAGLGVLLVTDQRNPSSESEATDHIHSTEPHPDTETPPPLNTERPAEMHHDEDTNETSQVEASSTVEAISPNQSHVQLVPLADGVYHGAFPDFGPSEDEVTSERINAFVDLIGKDIAWGYFSDNWFDGITFPATEVATLRQHGITPFIRLMPRSQFQNSGQDPVYTLDAIREGTFDTALREWARQARSTDTPLLVEFGTEMNGNWFTWAGLYNGGDSTTSYGDPEHADGPERFIDAYRHIVDLFRSEGAHNITWFFHINLESAPDAAWNQPAAYYPGDAYVDWIGISVYGAQRTGDPWISFQERMDTHYDRIANIAPHTPIAILEFGVDERPGESKADWINDALTTILEGRYPRIKAISYWHSTWTNTDTSLSRLRLDSSEESLRAYRELITSPSFSTTPRFSSE